MLLISKPPQGYWTQANYYYAARCDCKRINSSRNIKRPTAQRKAGCLLLPEVSNVWRASSFYQLKTVRNFPWSSAHAPRGTPAMRAKSSSCIKPEFKNGPTRRATHLLGWTRWRTSESEKRLVTAKANNRTVWCLCGSDKKEAQRKRT